LIAYKYETIKANLFIKEFTFILSLKACISQIKGLENMKTQNQEFKSLFYLNRLNSKQMLNLFCGIAKNQLRLLHVYVQKKWKNFSFILTESFESHLIN
jgi:hypothetical protein